jgi:hypothetical protein
VAPRNPFLGKNCTYLAILPPGHRAATETVLMRTCRDPLTIFGKAFQAGASRQAHRRQDGAGGRRYPSGSAAHDGCSLGRDEWCVPPGLRRDDFEV